MEEAHNTFTVEGFRQADYVDRLKWQKVRSPELMFWKNEPAFAACAGKVKYTQNVTAIRNVWYQKKNFWVINDVVEVPLKSNVIHYFNFHPDVKVTSNQERCEVIAENAEISLLIKFLGQIRIETVRASESTPSGWICQGYGYRTQSVSLKVSWVTSKQHSIMPFIIVPFKNTPLSFLPYVEWNAGTGHGAVQLEEACFALGPDEHGQIRPTEK